MGVGQGTDIEYLNFFGGPTALAASWYVWGNMSLLHLLRIKRVWSLFLTFPLPTIIKDHRTFLPFPDLELPRANGDCSKG